MIDKRWVHDSSGQATTEYILLISAIVTFFVAISAIIGQMNISKKVLTIVSGPFFSAYKYGHPKATGPDEGAAVMHPRINSNGNFRIFFGAYSQ